MSIHKFLIITDFFHPLLKDYRLMQNFEKYKFCPSTLSKLRNIKTDNWHGFIYIIEDWLVIFTAIFTSLISWKNLSFTTAFLIYIASIFLIGARQYALSEIMHQSTHKTLARNKHINFFLGTYASGYLIFGSFSGFSSSHIKHHLYLGDQDLDPDYKSLIDEGLYDNEVPKKLIHSYLTKAFDPFCIITSSLILIRRLARPNECSNEKKIRLTYLIVVLIFFVYSKSLMILVAYWLIPLLTFSQWIESITSLLEHYPLMKVKPHVDIFMTRNRLFSTHINFFLGAHYESYHLIHHLFPGVPSWHFKKAHCILMQDKTYAELHVSHDTVLELLRSMR